MSGRTRNLLLASVTVLTLAVTAAPALAQSGGIKGGFLYSTLSFDETSDVWDSSSGWTAGLFFGHGKEKTAGFLGEINIQKRGGGSPLGDVKLYYLNIPLMLRVGAGDAVNIYAIGGPWFDIKIGESNPDDVDLVQEWEGIDFGLTFGGGVELGFFIIEARANWGLINIAESALLFEGEKLTSRSFALQAGFRFK